MKISRAQKGVSKGQGRPCKDETRLKHSALMRSRWSNMATEQRASIGAKIAKARTKSPLAQDPDTKGCSACKGVFHRTFFYVDPRAKSGLQSACKECFGKRVKSFALRQPKKILSQRRARYNIDFDALWERQEGKCALCGELMELGGKQSLSAVIDHDHNCCPGRLGKSCGKCVRGLLHNRCNKFLGHIENRPRMVEQAISYLTRWREGQK